MEQLNQFSPIRIKNIILFYRINSPQFLTLFFPDLMFEKHYLSNKKWLKFLYIFILVLGYIFLSTYLNSSLINTFVVIGLILSLLYTSLIFDDLNNPLKSYSVIMLPASNAEKLLAGWIYTGILAPFFVLVSIYTLYFTGSIINLFIESAPFQLPEQNIVFQTFAYCFYYMAIQPIFLLGSICFRKLSFLKTIMSILFSFFVISGFVGLIIYFMFPELQGQNSYGTVNITLFDANGSEYWNLLTGLTAPLFLIISYYKLKEKQV